MHSYVSCRDCCGRAFISGSPRIWGGFAIVVELVDTLVSEASGRKPVEVQVLSIAPILLVSAGRFSRSWRRRPKKFL